MKEKMEFTIKPNCILWTSYGEHGFQFHRVGVYPNWFRRLMCRLLLGFRWEKLDYELNATEKRNLGIAP